MSTVLLDMAVSLDGVVGSSDGTDQGLYDWYFDPVGANAEIVAELLERTGAIVIGRNTFGGSDDAGFDDTPYAVPHFVITHRPPLIRVGAVDFHFVDGVEPAIRQAREAAGDRWVAIGGGADIARQALAAGLVDEIQLHVVPVVLGSGLRLFDDGPRLSVECTRVVEAGGVVHLRYRVG